MINKLKYATIEDIGIYDLFINEEAQQDFNHLLLKIGMYYFNELV